MTTSLRLLAWVVLLALLGVAGCGGRPPAPADPARARATLQLALDTWKQGEHPETLKDRQPPVIAVDHDWRNGERLLQYQVQTDEAFGADLRCQVLLSVQSKNGKTRQKKAVYSVGTGPALTVVREDP
jgi:hypothetical protein